MNYKIEISGEVVFTKFLGKLNLQSAKLYQDRLFSCADLGKEVKKGLMDFRQIESMVVFPSDYTKLIKREVEARRSGIVNAEAAVAIVVSKEIHKVAFQLYSSIIKEFGDYYKIFTDLKEALNWLELDLEVVPNFLDLTLNKD